MVQLIQTSKAGCDCHTVQSAPVSHKSPLPFDRQIGLWMSFCMARHALLGSHSSASVLPWYAGTRVHSQRLDAAPSNHWFVGKQAGIMAALAMTGLASYLDQLRLYPLQQGGLDPSPALKAFKFQRTSQLKRAIFPSVLLWTTAILSACACIHDASYFNKTRLPQTIRHQRVSAPSVIAKATVPLWIST